MLRDLQTRFREGLLGGDAGPAMAAIEEDAITPAQRFGIYRNNVLGSLAGALAAAFPVIERLVGQRFFQAAARAFVQQSPPSVPQLLAYGDRFPAFLEAFPPAAGEPYLGDVGRLEWARVEAMFAADAMPLDPAALTSVPPDALADLRFAAHPATRLVPSARFPIHTIWRVNQPDNPNPRPVDLKLGSQAALVTRPGLAVETVAISPGNAAFVHALLQHQPLGEAAEAALTAEPEFDLQQGLAAHLKGGTFMQVMQSSR